MKIAIINGSPRKNGATFKILDYFNDSLRKIDSDINIKVVHLIDYNLKYCVGCQLCYAGKCIITDDRIEEIQSIIKDSNGLIWGSPVYAANLTGLMRNFYDRVNMLMMQLLYRKPCINIVTYENGMAYKVQKIMKEMESYSGGYNIKSMAIKNPFNHNPLDKKLKSKIEKTARVFLKKIKKDKPPWFSVIHSKIVINIFFKPYIYKNKEQYQGIIDEWTERGIIKN